MNELAVLTKQEILGKEFTVYGDVENPLFLAKDVAQWIDHADVSSMLRTVDNDEKLLRSLSVSGQKREVAMVTEDGLYEILMLSRKPIAKAFKKEVKIMLKQIRQTGGYIPATQDDSDEAVMARAYVIAQNTLARIEAEKQKLLEEKEDLSIALNESLKFYTVAKYNKVYKMGWTLKECQEIGRQMTRFCRLNSIKVRKAETNDERFTETNSYPLTAWEQFFTE